MPFKDFTVGQALTSAEVDNFLMRQTVMVFDDATQRDAELDGFLTQGMVVYLKDINRLQKYDGTSFGPVGEDAILNAGNLGNILVSDGVNGAVWVANGTPGQNIVSAGTAGVVAENSISPLLLLGV